MRLQFIYFKPLPDIIAGFAVRKSFSRNSIRTLFGTTRINERTAAFGRTKSCPMVEKRSVGIVIKVGEPKIKATANSSID